MQKRYLFGLLIVVGVLVGVLVVVLRREREPEYGGKRLSEWVERFAPKDMDPRGQEPGQEAADAILHIGTNGVPYLLKWMRYEKPHWNSIHAALNSFLSDWTPSDPKEVRADGAAMACVILDHQGIGMVDGLSRLLHDPESFEGASRAATVLGYLEKPKFPAPAIGQTNQILEAGYGGASGIGALRTNALRRINAEALKNATP